MIPVNSKPPFLAAFLILLTGHLLSAGSACCGVQEQNDPTRPAKSGDAPEDGVFGHYEKISAALVADDLDAVLEATGEAVGRAGKDGDERLAGLLEELGHADDLDTAREAFLPLSREVILAAAGKDGFYVMSCPMVENGKWLQSDDQVKNPYMGQRMVACGGVEMETADMELSGCCEERRACCDEAGGCCPV